MPTELNPEKPHFVVCSGGEPGCSDCLHSLPHFPRRVLRCGPNPILCTEPYHCFDSIRLAVCTPANSNTKGDPNNV